LVSTTKVWVDANMKETDLTYVKVGDHVDVSVDTYPGRTGRGPSRASAPRAARSLDPARRIE
jgi:membrane fusion protein (multidrug efflux system)